MKTIQCFEVKGHTDTTEGFGPIKVVARFSNYKAAEQFVRSKSYERYCATGYRSNSDVGNINESNIMILDSLNELEVVEKETLKKSVLLKLSKQERDALGL